MKNKIIYCYKCNRGGNGNDTDKCSCGWRETEPSVLGCFAGSEIIGEIKKKPKVKASKLRYLRFLEYGDGFRSFIDYLRWDSEPERSWNENKKRPSMGAATSCI